MRKISGNNSLKIIVKICVIQLMVFLLFLIVKTSAAAQNKLEQSFIGYTDPILLNTYGDIKMYGSKSVSITMPFEVNLARTLVFENTGTRKVTIALNNDPYLSGDGTKYADASAVVRHPHPGSIYLGPGEKKSLVITFEMYSKGKSCTNQSLFINFAFNIEGQNYEVSLPNKVTVLSDKQISNYKDTGIIKGQVVDSKGKAISGVTVRLRNNVETNNQKLMTKTNKSGRFSFKVPTYLNKSNGSWSTYTVVVNPPNNEYGGVGYGSDYDYKATYNVKYKVIPLETGQTDNSTYKLSKAASKLTYVTKKVLDLGIQSYTYDASDDGNVLAFIPFHAEGFPDSAQKMTVATKTGKLLFTKSLEKETPAGDVSVDGAYIVTTVKDQTKDARVVIYNKRGKEVYSCAPERTTDQWDCIYETSGNGYAEVKLSDDNKYLAVGNWTDSLFLIDWKNDKVLWEAFAFGMVREIKFDDDYLYASSGDGYIRCYKLTDGTMVWEQFVMGWACDMEISEHYIAITAKQAAAPLYVFNKADGSLKWTYPLGKRGSGIRISDNEKYLWYGNDISGGSNNMQNLVFNLSTGKPMYCLPGSAQMAGFFDNDKYIATKNGSWLGIFLTSTGEQVWAKNLAPNGGGDSISQTLWVSKDGKYLVTVVNNDSSSRFYGQAYFLQKK